MKFDILSKGYDMVEGFWSGIQFFRARSQSTIQILDFYSFAKFQPAPEFTLNKIDKRRLRVAEKMNALLTELKIVN